jgi:probable HAF family extracellular repeat protein
MCGRLGQVSRIASARLFDRARQQQQPWAWVRSATAALSVLAFVLLSSAALGSKAATFSGIGDLPGGSVYSVARGISADGSTVVGQSNSAAGPEAFRWVKGGGIEGLGDLPGGTFASEATAASADGSTIVGSGDDGELPWSFNAFRWTEESGVVALPDFFDGRFASDAEDVTADGSIVAGSSYVDFFGTPVCFASWAIAGETLLWCT